MQKQQRSILQHGKLQARAFIGMVLFMVFLGAMGASLFMQRPRTAAQTRPSCPDQNLDAQLRPLQGHPVPPFWDHGSMSFPDKLVVEAPPSGVAFRTDPVPSSGAVD